MKITMEGKDSPGLCKCWYTAKLGVLPWNPHDQDSTELRGSFRPSQSGGTDVICTLSSLIADLFQTDQGTKCLYSSKKKKKVKIKFRSIYYYILYISSTNGLQNIQTFPSFKRCVKVVMAIPVTKKPEELHLFL